MRALILVLALALSGLARAGEPSALRLSRPSVVVVFTSDAEVTKAARAEPGFDDFIDDFEYYAQALAAALHNNKDVAFYRSDFDTVSFGGGERSPVTRQSLSGYGFIVYVPGRAPVVFPGVATEADVLCALKELDRWLKVPQQCGPNKSFKPTPLRGSA